MDFTPKQLREMIEWQRNHVIAMYAETYDDYARSPDPRMISEVGWVFTQVRRLKNELDYLETLYADLEKAEPGWQWKTE